MQLSCFLPSVIMPREKNRQPGQGRFTTSRRKKKPNMEACFFRPHATRPIAFTVAVRLSRLALPLKSNRRRGSPSWVSVPLPRALVAIVTSDNKAETLGKICFHSLSARYQKIELECLYIHPVMKAIPLGNHAVQSGTVVAIMVPTAYAEWPVLLMNRNVEWSVTELYPPQHLRVDLATDASDGSGDQGATAPHRSSGGISSGAICCGSAGNGLGQKVRD
jgi:hypothetical protein